MEGHGDGVSSANSLNASVISQVAVALNDEPFRRLESIGESLRPEDPVQLALPLFNKGPDMIAYVA